MTSSDTPHLPGNLEEWVTSKREVPQELIDVARTAGTEDLEQLFRVIDNKLMELYGEKQDTARSFVDSRFQTMDAILTRGMVSCGALVVVFGTILRKLGIPVRFVHGIEPGQTGENRHSWLDVLDVRKGDWTELDPTQNHRRFKPIEGVRRIKVYHDWDDELRRDYESGNF